MPRPGNKRLFFALWPDDGLRERIVRATRAEAQGTGGKLTPPENLHMTLHFLGATPQELIHPLIERASMLPLSPFELTLEQYGCWQRAGTLWLGPNKTPPPLAQLVRGIGQISHELGLPRERRAFIPHLTLARKVNRLAPKEPPGPMRWSVNEFVLTESKLGGSHSRYTILEHFG